ncbi:MAG: hypothetical protein LBK13_13185, partial [Spirochaetales bacterium]|nr:hypothetical protein [Spirochaetales bacterium]
MFGAFLAQSAKNRAIRSKSSDLLMQILRAVHFYPLREDGRLSALRPLYTAQTFLSLSPVLLVKSHAIRVHVFGRD